MNTKNTKYLIASTILTLVGGMGFFVFLAGSKDVFIGFAALVALAIFGGIELRGAARHLPERLPKNAIELYRSVKSDA